MSLNNEVLRRIFNRGVQSFIYGGRAYGAIYQRLPEEMRQCIRINNEPTVEIDYSAYHIRMLYHLIGEPYMEDPYVQCAGEKYRDVFKSAALILINSKSESKARYTIKDELQKNGIPLPDVKSPMKWIIAQFKEAHPQIAGYICKDMGATLMNIDSHIMNGILMRLMDKGILGLNVYDSVIVAGRYKDTLIEIMITEYENKMKFKPVLKVEE